MPLAVCVSLALHGSALAVLDRMPRGWQLAENAPAAFGSATLQAQIRTHTASRQLGPPTPTAAVPMKTAALARPGFGAVAPPVYLPASELDEKPLIRTTVHPEFPAFAPVAEGRVVLRLYIGDTGNVDDVAVVHAEPAQVFEEAAVRAFSRASFTPGRKDGTAVKSALTLELLFGTALQAAQQARAAEGPMWQPPRRARPKKENL
jgi:TonB family protein